MLAQVGAAGRKPIHFREPAGKQTFLKSALGRFSPLVAYLELAGGAFAGECLQTVSFRRSANDRSWRIPLKKAVPGLAVA